MRFFPSWAGLIGLAAVTMLPIAAEGQRAAVAGRVTEAGSGASVAGARVTIEDIAAAASTDSSGSYRINGVAAGPHVVRVARLGFAPTRVAVVVPARGVVTLDITLSRNALSIPGVTVTADPIGRARGETGTATVIGREAIRNQVAASLAGVLELVPGVPLQPPGIDGVQQFSLRSIPIGGGDFRNPGLSGETLASLGTTVILDGVPISNNANLQSLGSRAELSFSTSAGGGVDLRRIPATTLERVEVIRGVASARWGDLTQGAVIVDTRAGRVPPEMAFRFDRRTLEVSGIGGGVFGRQAITANINAARTRLSPGFSKQVAERVATQLAWRSEFGRVSTANGNSASSGDNTPEPRLVLDVRADGYSLRDVTPLSSLTGRSEQKSTDLGTRASLRSRLRMGTSDAFELTLSGERVRQKAFAQTEMVRGALPFSDRLEPGRSIGRYVIGQYLGRADVDGASTNLYSRSEWIADRSLAGIDHGLRLGGELRREWNSGAGYQFDPEFPPQSTFTGVEGFDRPRRFDAISPVATSALYADDRVARSLGGGTSLTAQFGLRADILHAGTTWLSGAEDVVIQPRGNIEIAPGRWLRLRFGAGRFAKSPTMAQLSPAPQWYDLVNVNRYTNDPKERLAVITTFLREADNPDLGFSISDKVEASAEVLAGATVVSVTAYSDRVSRGIGVRPLTDFLLRDRYNLSDSTLGTGKPPTILEPPAGADTIPIVVYRPNNNITLKSRGVEITGVFPEIRALRTRVTMQGAWVQSTLDQETIEFDQLLVRQLQVDASQSRTPVWAPLTRKGKRGIATARIVHQQPAVGLVITGSVQFSFAEQIRNLGPVDTLSFIGYMQRSGSVIIVPGDQKGASQYRDLRVIRRAVFRSEAPLPNDWMLSLQVSKSLFGDGRLSFYAFNALDRVGKFDDLGATRRLWPSTRFGLELSLPLSALAGARLKSD